MQSTPERMLRNEALLVVAAAVTGFWFSVYNFGLGNHFEQLPGVLKWMNSELFKADFEINATTEYGARYYFYLVMSQAAGLLGLWQSYLVVAILAWVAWVLAIWHFARNTLQLSAKTSALVATLITAGSPYVIGATASSQGPSLIPSSLVWPLMVLLVDFAFRGRWLSFVGVALVAVLFHPITVAGAVGILVGAALLTTFGEDRTRLARRMGGGILALGVFLVGYYLIWYRPMLSRSATPAELTDILVARAPHHYSPAFFWRDEVGGIVAVLCALGAATWFVGRVAPHLAKLRNFCIAVWALTVVGWIAGGIGVELLGSATMTVLQVFRFSYLSAWCAAIAFAIALEYASERLGGWVHAWTMALVAGFAMSDGRLVGLAVLGFVAVQYLASARRPLAVGVQFAVLAIVLVFFAACAWKRHWAMVLVLGAFLYGMRLYLDGRAWLRGVLVGGAIVASLVCGFSAGHRLPLLPPTVLRLGDHLDPLDGAAAFARDHSTLDELFLTPPFGGRFRLVSQRAIVVGALGFPSRPDLFFVWRDRMRDCYGTEQTVLGRDKMNVHYNSLDDSEIRRLARIYGFSKAVVAAGSKTGLPVVYHDNFYKIISIEPGHESLPH